MEIVEKISKLRSFLEKERQSGKRIGFVPTMGAIHEGHLSLLERCKAENEVSVVSIFVNPTQFNQNLDFILYPRTLDLDCLRLEIEGCDYAFTPSEEEMYPEADKRKFNFGKIENVMEGAYRRGHFNGVAQIVSKLFDVVEPDNAYFGEKDYQQVAIIRALVKQLNSPVQIVTCPTVRDKNGLALSSRNELFLPKQCLTASFIAATLKQSCSFKPNMSVKEVIKWVKGVLKQGRIFHVEYFEIVDGESLLPIRNWEETRDPVGCIAVYFRNVRLIDNIKYS
jgi:pantoate--beta-alanine ligase